MKQEREGKMKNKKNENIKRIMKNNKKRKKEKELSTKEIKGEMLKNIS